MKFTLSWLKDHFETEADTSKIVEVLTEVGLEVENVDDCSQFSPFIIAKVVRVELHPDADRLKILTVDKGNGREIQVVCGASNARKGMVGVLAEPGVRIPGIDMELSVGIIRGVKSYGMMCSECELGLSDEHEGIIDLPDDAPVGASFSDYAGLDDPVIEIAVTPNRPDALGVAGIARDLAARGLGRFKPVVVRSVKGSFPCPVNVKLEFEEGAGLCPAFGLRYVQGVKNGPSPRWMQQRLQAIGLQPINALVDITNYVTLDLGRPLHVFDADRVKGDLVVRCARDGEELISLDGKAYSLSRKNCVIADDNGVASLSGITGGEMTGCSDKTVNVLIESAVWEPSNIARSGRDLGIVTDARCRFERGVDPAFAIPGLDHATRLVIELCGGKPSQMILAGEIPVPELTIDFPVSEVRRLLGIEIKTERTIISILERLGFEVRQSGNILEVKTPTWRPDIKGKSDLVEEIMRIHGVNSVKPSPPDLPVGPCKKMLAPEQARMRKIQRCLATRGMLEAITWSFVSKGQAKCFGGGQESLALTNPISADMSDMRPSLLPTLISAAQRNANYGQGDIALFEVGAVFHDNAPSRQKHCAGGIRRGASGLVGTGRHWRDSARTASIFDVKADALAVLETCGIEARKIRITSEVPDWYHPGRSGTICLGPKMVLGVFGEIHPLTLEAMNVDNPICGFEIWIDAIPAPRKKVTRTRPPLKSSNLQTVKRDFSFVVDRDVQSALLIQAINAVDKKRITNVQVFDVFEGAAPGKNRKSIAVEITLQPEIKTFTDEEIKTLAQKIIEHAKESVGATLR